MYESYNTKTLRQATPSIIQWKISRPVQLRDQQTRMRHRRFQLFTFYNAVFHAGPQTQMVEIFGDDSQASLRELLALPSSIYFDVIQGWETLELPGRCNTTIAIGTHHGVLYSYLALAYRTVGALLRECA